MKLSGEHLSAVNTENIVKIINLPIANSTWTIIIQKKTGSDVGIAIRYWPSTN